MPSLMRHPMQRIRGWHGLVPSLNPVFQFRLDHVWGGTLPASPQGYDFAALFLAAYESAGAFRRGLEHLIVKVRVAVGRRGLCVAQESTDHRQRANWPELTRIDA